MSILTAQAVTVAGYGDPELIVVRVWDDGIYDGEPLARIPLTIGEDGKVKDNVERLLAESGFRLAGSWEVVPWGATADLVEGSPPGR